MLTFYLSTLGIVPYFTLRTFVPLFMTALVARFGSHWALAADLAGVELLSAVPVAFTSDVVLVVLGVLAASEVGALKNPELREFLTLFDSKIKATAASAVALAILAGDPLQQVAATGSGHLTAGLGGGWSFAHVWALAIGFLVWLTAASRGLVMGTLIELDEDDDLGLQGLLSWLEDTFSFLGVLVAFLLPVLAVVFVAFTLLTLYLARRYLEHLEKAARVPCANCQEPMTPCGIRCARCGQPNARIFQVGWFGRLLDRPATDLMAHRQSLVARKRCPSCGERYAERRVDQRCTACETEPFASPEELERYLAALRASLPKTLAVLLVLGFVPLFGLVPGVIYYRCSLIASLRCYLPRSSSFLMRWAVRLINLLLIVLQPIPLFGALTLPLMGLTNFWAYQGALRRQGQQRLRAPLVPVPG